MVAVLRLADQRLALMPEVAAAKWPRHLAISAPAREAEVIAAAGEHAAAIGLARAPIQRLMALQTSLARSTQEALYVRWQADASAYPGAARDLDQTLRPLLDRLSVQLLTALYLAAPTLGRSDFEALATPLAQQGLPHERWPDEARLELIHALAAVRFSELPGAARARDAGVIRFGTPADYAPFSVVTAGGVSGSDIELALQFAGALGLRPIFIHSSWRTLLDDLAADRFDIAVGGVSLTPARHAVTEASAPLARSGKTAIGRCADLRRLGSFAVIDSPSVTVIENPGGTNEDFARRRLQHARLTVHVDNMTVFDELLAGHADAMFTDEAEVTVLVHRHTELCRLLSEAFEATDKVFLTAPGSGWRTLLDPWLAAELERGTPARLLEEYSAR